MADEQQQPSSSPEATQLHEVPSSQEPAKQTDISNGAEKVSKEEAREKLRGDRNLGGGPKNALDNSGHIEGMVNAGDNHHISVTNNYYNYDPSAAIKEAVDVSGGKSEQSDRKGLGHKNLFASRHYDNTPGTKETMPPAPIPQTQEEVENWYSNLTTYSQCFVQAMAIFEGATIPEIAFATNRFYEPIAEEAREQALKQPVSGEMPASPVRKLEAPDGLQFRDRLRQTYVIIDRSCLVWQDSNDSGPSSLRMRLLQFLAIETSWHKSDFLSRLEEWAGSLDDDIDNNARALWTQGIIWWWQNPNRLREVANAYSDDEDWYRASYLLYGAYLSHRFENAGEANDRQASIILQCIHDWSQRARKKHNGTKGCAAALAYMLIGFHSLPVALKGLDYLLELPRSPSGVSRQLEQLDDQKENGVVEGDFADIYDAVVLSYRSLAEWGYTRTILQHLAQSVEKDSHHRIDLTGTKYNEREYHRNQRTIRLIATLDIFFRVAKQSLENVKYRGWVEYDLTSSLPELVDLNNTGEHGREVILTGVLNGAWTSEVCTLLCGALIEKNISDFASLALGLLREWADFVLKDQGPHPDRVRQSYIQFLIQLDTTLQSWCRYWSDIGYRPPPVIEEYRRRIQHWGRDAQPKKRTITRALIDEVLLQLPS